MKSADISVTLDQCLQEIEARLDDKQEVAQRAAWQAFLDNRCAEDVFLPAARKPAPPRIEWPNIHINDAQEDVDLMVFHELVGVSGMLNGGRLQPNVRCNYGTGILPSLFGCALFTMPRETHTLPTAYSLGSDRVRALLDAGIPDIRSGLGGRVFDCAERFLELFAQHPKINRYVALYHPDLQGPVDVAEVVWGSEIFLAFYDEPDVIKAFLKLITDTYAAFMRAWYKLVPLEDYSTHWSLMHRGRLMLRNDSLMNLSPEIYTEFVQPCDERLLDEFGGGAIHFCGRADHFIAPLSTTRGLTAINLSQPELNDMETIYRHTVDKQIKIIGLPWLAVAAAHQVGRPLKWQVQSCPPAVG